MVESDDSKHDCQTDRRNDIKCGIVHKVLCFTAHCDDKNDRHDCAKKEIRDKKILISGHGDYDRYYYASRTLTQSEKTAAREPTRNVGNEIGPAPVGMKKPITAEATSIFERSAQYLEMIAI